MNKIYWAIGAVTVVVLAVVALGLGKTPLGNPTMSKSVSEKVYVALEGEGKVAVIDAANNQLLTTIDLSEEKNGGTVKYMAHNVQVAPDGSSVAVTANVEEGDMDMEGEHKEGMNAHVNAPDQLVVIDPRTDTISRRVPIESDSHLAHVAYESDSKTVLVSLQEKGAVYEVDTGTGAITRKTVLGATSGPHGLRLTPDGTKAYIALLSGNGVAIRNSVSGEAEVKRLPGAAVQTAVTPDGTLAFASVYDTKEVAWFDVESGAEGSIQLPEDSRGPVQLYPTPDSRYLYVADQGYYFDQPIGNTVYRIDVASKIVDTAILAGSAPHGIVVSKDGSRVYVTNLLGDDVSVIDTATDTEIARIPVGVMPNGISIWNASMGGTP